MGEQSKVLLSYDHINVAVHFTVYGQSLDESHRVIEKVVRILELEKGLTVDNITQVLSGEGP